MSDSAKPWVDGPFKLISPDISGDKIGNEVTNARRMAAEMTVVHNCLLRGVNAVYLQVDNVVQKGSDQDKLDFANFAYQWSEMLEEHHEIEETLAFPQIDEMTGVPGLMDANVDQHKLFHDGIHEYRDYLSKVTKGDAGALDGGELKRIIDSFMGELRTHLEAEIHTLVDLEKFQDRIDWGSWFSKLSADIGSNAMKTSKYRTELFPLMFVLHDSTYEGGIWKVFPPLPWIVTILMRWMFMYTNQRWWRFAGCDFAGQPRELPFV